MNIQWSSLENERPPQGVILLVYGPLGLDLAVNLADHWYFKKGDDWSASNLEHWSCDTPTQWAEFAKPVEYSLANGRTTFHYCLEKISNLFVGVGSKSVSGEMSLFAGNLKN